MSLALPSVRVADEEGERKSTGVFDDAVSLRSSLVRDGVFESLSSRLEARSSGRRGDGALVCKIATRRQVRPGFFGAATVASFGNVFDQVGDGGKVRRFFLVGGRRTRPCVEPHLKEFVAQGEAP